MPYASVALIAGADVLWKEDQVARPRGSQARQQDSLPCRLNTTTEGSGQNTGDAAWRSHTSRQPITSKLPSSFVTPDQVPELARIVMNHAELLSIRLGYEPSSHSQVSDSMPERHTNKRFASNRTG
jgi:hypothetical protein